MVFECQKLQEIGSDAFNYTRIRSFSIPSSVRMIGKNVFEHCMNLSIIEICDDSQLESIDDSILSLELILMIPEKFFHRLFDNK